MAEKSFPLNKEQLEKIASEYGTPFYLYDEKAIRDNMARFTKAFSIFPEFREYFAVKAMPNPYMLKILAECGSTINFILWVHKMNITCCYNWLL